MTTDAGASSPPQGDTKGTPAPGLLASFLHRYLPVWRTVYALLGQVASLRHQLAHLQQQLNEHRERIDEACLRTDDAHQLILASGERLEDLRSRVQLDRRRSGQSDTDLAMLDDWYQDLQELHRGAPEAVLDVQKSYLAHFNDRSWLREGGPVIDLGCGRGEWLSLMAEEGWTVKGVDSSEHAINEARERGLDVELGDLVDFLEASPENTLAGVTAFQVIEHLPVGRITALMHAAYRALIPGGMLVLETPNPENLQVASYGFWLDPTHRHPIPPPLIMDLSYHVGFRDGSVLRKNPWPQWKEQEAETSLESEVAYRLYGPQDYAILVYKPTSAD
jgi:2-polyprenyl-3-methyl-5-hydroxy-6-metoxy-1,4-benzoquinol methylase